MGTITEWAKKHQDAIIIGSIVGAIAGIAILAATSSTNNPSTTPVVYTPEKPPKFGPGVITKYDDIDEAIFTDLAPEIENHVLDVNESGKMVRTEKKFWCGPNGNYAMFIPFKSNEDYWTMDDPDE